MEHLRLAHRFDEPAAAWPVRHSRSWNGVSAEAVHIGKTDPFDFAWKGPTHFLVLLDLQRSDGETRAADLAPNHDKDLRGKMTFIPNGCEISGWVTPVKRKNAFTAAYLDPATMSAELDEANLHIALEPMIYFKDRTLSSTLVKFRSVLDEASPNSMYAETLGLLLGLEICKVQSRVSQQTSTQRHGLSCGTENLIREYIEANLSRDITLSELADLAGFSRFHFARAFKRSTGLPPHQYLLRQRIERAKELLALGGLPVTEIAASVGFAGPAPLALTFRRLTGRLLKEFGRSD